MSKALFGFVLKKRTLSAALLTAALTFGADASRAAEPTPSAALQAKTADAGKLLADASASSSVRVTLVLNARHATPPASMAESRQFLTELKSVAADAQASFVADHITTRPDKAARWNAFVFDYAPSITINATAADLEELAADPRVAKIDPPILVQTTLTQSVPLIGMPAAYTNGATGSGRMVAVLDTGVQNNHPFLSPRVTAEACFSGGGSTLNTLCPNGQLTQTGPGAAAPCAGSCSHGSHVAGIAAGFQSSGLPPSGVAKSANILGIQVFTWNSSHTNVGAYNSDINQALQYVLTQRNGALSTIDSINMSLGGSPIYTGTCDTADSTATSLINSLKAVGVATVIAAGNNSTISTISWPACISSAIAVGATDKQDKVSWYTNMSNKVELFAPGGDAGLTATGGILSSVPTSTFGYKSGTSMSTPHVAGAFAAIRSRVPTATVDQIRTALATTGTPITDSTPRDDGTSSGSGLTKPRIRVDLAVASLIGGGGGGSNDNFANATVISGISGTVTGNNASATRETGEPRHYAGTTGNKSVWWKWTAPSAGQATLSTVGSSFDTVLAVYTGSSVSTLTQLMSNDDYSGLGLLSKISLHVVAGATYYIAVDGYSSTDFGNIVLTGSFTPSEGPAGLFGSTLPYARSVQVGTAATAFANILNATGQALTGCYLQMPANSGRPGVFQYQTASASNTLTGVKNTPVDIPAGAIQNFVFGFTPSAAFSNAEIAIGYDCANSSPAATVIGVNTFLLSASAGPAPDMVAIGATVSNDGVVRIPGSTGSLFFATAAVNIGAAGSITAKPDDGGRGLPVQLTICQTNPSTGACLSPPAAQTTATVANNQTVTYAVFVTATGAIPLDPANNRLFLRLRDSGNVVRGATHVAVTTATSGAGQQASAR